MTLSVYGWIFLTLISLMSCGKEQPGIAASSDSTTTTVDTTQVPQIPLFMDSAAVAVAESLQSLADTLAENNPAKTDSQTTTTPDNSTIDQAKDLINMAMGLPPEAKTDSNQTAQNSQTGKESDEETVKKPSFRITFGTVFSAILLFIITLFAIRYLTNLLEAIAERWTRTRFTVKSLVPILRIITWSAIFYIIIVQIFEVSDQTLLALGASASIAVGFASQDILKNVFGGLMLLLDRPFQVGDKVQVGNYYGEVVQIGLRTVRIVTPDDNLVSIPNAEMMNEAVSNANAGESNCQVVAEFYLPPDIDTVQARRIAYRAAAVSRYIYLNKPIAVIFKNEIHEGRSMLKMRLKAYVLDLRYEFPFSSEMTEIVMREFRKAGLVEPDELSWERHPDEEEDPSVNQ